MRRQDAPTQSLATLDVVAIVVGLVIGAGIFKTPATVATNTGSEVVMLLAWLAGGVISLAGALCYAELASAFPSAGGEYHFLRRAYGPCLGFLFAWSRLVVLQTGSIALLAFVLGDYLSALLPLGPHSTAWYAFATIAGLTALNIAGLQASKHAQNVLTLMTVLGLLVVIIAGISGPSAQITSDSASAEPTLGLAMIFVLLTYGGWNEAAYVSAELRADKKGMARVLATSIAIITAVYLLVSLAYIKVLGIGGMGQSDVVTADAMREIFGESGALFVSLLIVLAVVTSLNVTILTGARSSYAMARDFPLFDFLGRWSGTANAPISALVAQGSIALILVSIGSVARSGFETMVHYVAPVFWLFFLLTGLALFVLRWREPAQERPFRVPGYPYVPLVFVGTCVYMLYSSIAYTGLGAVLGVIVLLAGVPFLLLVRGRPASPTQGGQS